MENNHLFQPPKFTAKLSQKSPVLLYLKDEHFSDRFFATLIFFLTSFLSLSAQPQTFFYPAWTQTGGTVSPGFTNRVVTVAGSGTVSYSASSVLLSTNNYGLRLTEYSSSGTTSWVANFDLGAGGTTHVGGIALDPSGNVIVTGSAYNGSTNGHDLFVVKFNSSGTKLWHQTYSGASTGTDAGAAVICNASGNIFVTGIISQTFPDVDAITLCYSSNGTLIWDETWDNADLFDAGATLSLLGTRVFVTGASQTNFNTWEYAVLRYEQSSGSLVSSTVTSAGGTNIELVSAATLDASGNMYLTGALGVSGQGFNIKTIKLSPSLAILWTANWNGTANLDDAGRSIAVDTAGNVFVAGYTTANDRDGILLKYSPSGSLVFAKSDTITGAGEYTGLALSSAQEPFVGGYSSQLGTKDFQALCYTNSGTLLWTDTYNGYSNEDDVAQQVVPDGYGNFLLSGTSGESTLAVKYNRHALLLPLEEDVNAPFIENRGQVMGTDSTAQDDVRYYTRSNYPNTYISDDRVSFVFAHIDTVASSQDTMTRLDMRFLNETSTVAVGLEQQDAFHNYYLGHIPEGRERVPLNNKVLHPNIYTNIDALYGLGQDGFFARFVCKPSSSPGLIRLLFSGHTALSVETDGSLRIESELEDLILAPPTAVFSDASGTESNASWAPEFFIINDSTVRFLVGTVPSGSSLIIKTGRERYDPENECDYYWSTYFGETGDEKVKGSDVDDEGNMYFTGHTTSNLFPVLNAIQNALIGSSDAFVACFRQLDEQKWATFYGGTDVAPFGLLVREDALAIKWNAHNNHVYFVGRTPAADFPLEQTTGYFSSQVKSGIWDSRGFIVKLKAENGVRDWATFFGDSEKRFDAVTALHIRENGNVVVGGYSQQAGNNQTSFPFFPYDIPTAIPHIQTQGGLYIAEFDLINAQVWATKLTNELQVNVSPVLADITEDTNGKLFVVGNIPGDDANDFIPLGPGSMAFSGLIDVFLLEFSQFNELSWSTYLGGGEQDIANSVVSMQNRIFVTGTTTSSDFPTVIFGDPTNPLLNDVSLDGYSDIFVSQFENNDLGGNSLVWSRYLGGAGGPTGADSQPTVSHNGGDDGAVGNATTVLSNNEIAITGKVSDEFSPLTASGCPYYYGNINKGVSQIGMDAVLIVIKFREITFSTYWGGDTPNGTGVDDGTTISKGINSEEKAFVLLGGYTNSRKIANQGETIPVCRELPFPGSYYKENFLGGSTDAFVSKIYFGECLTSAVITPLDQIGALNIQPNPATDIISITIPMSGTDGANIFLFDATGKLVANIPSLSSPAAEPSIEVEVGSFPLGIYFVTVQSAGRTYSGKFVKM